MLLMTVHDISRLQRPKESEMEGIRSLAEDVPRALEHLNPQQADSLFTASIAERDQDRIDDLRHVPGHFKRVPFSAADDSAGTEQRRDDVHDLHRPLTTSTRFVELLRQPGAGSAPIFATHG
jgi:hypothetical protein